MDTEAAHIKYLLCNVLTALFYNKNKSIENAENPQNVLTVSSRYVDSNGHRLILF